MTALALVTPTEGVNVDAPSLAILDHVPPGCDVVPLRGMVAIFDRRWRKLIEGRYYVVESQAPVGGMSWEAYDDMNARHGRGEPRVMIKTTRRVVKATRREATGDAWWLRHESGFSDGPIADWAAGRDFVGEVIGIYRPCGA